MLTDGWRMKSGPKRLRSSLRQRGELRDYVLWGLMFLYFIGATLFFFMLFVENYFPAQENSQVLQLSVEIIGILVTAGLYIGLLYLYNQIKDLEQIERRPHLEVARYSLNGDSVVVWLSNYGKGSAIDLQLELDLVEPKTFPIRVEPEPVPLRREGDGILRRETSVPPEEDYIPFRASPAIKIEDEDGELRTFRNWGAAVKPLARAGIDKVGYELRIHYSNQLSEPKTIPVTRDTRGSDVQRMTLLEETSHGIPGKSLDPGEVTLDTKMVESVEGLVDKEILGDGSKKILKTVAGTNNGLPISNIGVFQNQDVEQRVCDQLVYYGLLEIEDEREVLTSAGQKPVPEKYKITEKGREYLARVG